jgi:hypothetical protein
MDEAPGAADGKRFAHRRNKDGSVDSICLACYRTVATAGSEEELLAAERKHKCEPR